MMTPNSAAHRQIAALRFAERKRRESHGGSYDPETAEPRWPYVVAVLGVIACVLAVWMA